MASPNSCARASRCNTPARLTSTHASCWTATMAGTPTIGCSATARRAKSRNSNWARDPRVMKLDTPQFDPDNLGTSPNARRVRWEQLLNENKGKIDVSLAQQMLADHVDSFEKKT